MDDSTTYAHTQTHGAQQLRQEAAEEQRAGHRHVPTAGLVHGDTHGRLARAATGIDVLGGTRAADIADALRRAVQARALTSGTGVHSQQPALVIHRTRLGDDLRDLARAQADIARTAGKTSGAAATLKVGDRFFTAISMRRSGLAPEVSHALRRVPARARSPYHGHCAEIGCLDRAFRAGRNPRGGDIRVVEISSSRTVHGSPMAPCSTCEHVLRQFEVEWR